MFIEIPQVFLNEIATKSERIPTLYYSKFFLVRKIFWMRLRLIHLLMKSDKIINKKYSCLDFGGGGGVFLPTLSKSFKNVTCVDLENKEAEKIIDNYNLDNVYLSRNDINDCPNIGKFDVVVAADVLEHFEDLSRPVSALKMWLNEDGFLYTSLPTENIVYNILRKIFKIEKPYDHYYSGYDVEKYLINSGFVKLKTVNIPLGVNFLPLFLISSWQLEKTNM